jgi:signal transduction histidine kinase
VQLDPARWTEALLELVSNARDAMGGEGQLRIETVNVELDEEYVAEGYDAGLGPHVVVSISDTGRGMSPAVLEQVCEPFFTTKAQGDGAGLGLPAVYGFVRASGGHLWVHSEPGRGTTVEVLLPLAGAVPGQSRQDGEVAGGLGGSG